MLIKIFVYQIIHYENCHNFLTHNISGVDIIRKKNTEERQNKICKISLPLPLKCHKGIRLIE
jgi:hypothetical protein